MRSSAPRPPATEPAAGKMSPVPSLPFLLLFCSLSLKSLSRLCLVSQEAREQRSEPAASRPDLLPRRPSLQPLPRHGRPTSLRPGLVPASRRWSDAVPEPRCLLCPVPSPSVPLFSSSHISLSLLCCTGSNSRRPPPSAVAGNGAPPPQRRSLPALSPLRRVAALPSRQVPPSVA